MKIVCLVENTKCEKSCGAKHGLSFYIETMNHKILSDVGPNDLYYKNAKKLGINIEDVDTLILSHGHFNHEQYHILRDGNDTVLMTACLHNGIVTIMEAFNEISATMSYYSS